METALVAQTQTDGGPFQNEVDVVVAPPKDESLLEKELKRYDEIAYKMLAAESFVSATEAKKLFAEARAIHEEYVKLGEKAEKSFKEKIQEAQQHLLKVNDFFAHKKKGELFDGHETAESWYLNELGCTASYARRCLKPRTTQGLLPPTTQGGVRDRNAKPQDEVPSTYTSITPRESAVKRIMSFIEATAKNLKIELKADVYLDVSVACKNAHDNLVTSNAAAARPEPEPPEPEPPKRKKAQASSSTKVPTFAYPGAKAKLAKNIAAMLPSGKRFVEPFAGRGNVFFYVAAHNMYRSYWLNDIQTAPFLFTMRIGHILGVPKPGKESLYKYRAIARDKTKSPLRRNHALLSEPYLCWNGGVYGQSGGTGGGTQAGYYKKLRLASEILRGTDTKITRLDYRDVLTQCGEGDVIYLDPPYMNANVKAYTDKTLEHREMVEILKSAKFKWILSEYKQPLYIEAFGEPVLRISVKRGMGKPNGGSKGQKEAVECFWTNFAVA